jgi:hypothetical protein
MNPAAWTFVEQMGPFGVEIASHMRERDGRRKTAGNRYPAR